MRNLDDLILYQIFECLTVVFETFIVYQYISGLFEKRNTHKSSVLWYILFGLGLMLLSLFFFHIGIVLMIYTLVGVFVLVLGIYKTSMLSRIFAVFYFSAIMVGSEIFTSGLISQIWNIDLSNALEYGLPRVLCIVIAKLLQILAVKATTFVASWKTSALSKGEPKLVLPLFFCQVFSIILSHYIFVICYKIYGCFEPLALFAMAGIMYLNIIVFWYFDRIKAAFEYKSKNEAAELKNELQKQYFEILNEHQQETDALWHDMKKHINLMKTLINTGQQETTSEYIKELEGQMSNTIKIIHTGHPILSALLTEQTQRAKKANISFILDVRLESEMKIEPVDLCIILGNLFDNAFEACMFLPSEQDRYIKATITQRNTAMAIKIENAYNADAKLKHRVGKHGFGLKNVRQAVKKYNGKTDIIEGNEIFRVSIVIP